MRDRNRVRPVMTADFLRAIGSQETLVSRIQPAKTLTERQICASIGSRLELTSKERHVTRSFVVVIKRLRVERDAPTPIMAEQKWHDKPFDSRELLAGLIAQGQIVEADTDELPRPHDCLIYFKLVDTAYMDYGPGHEDGSNYGDVDYLYLQYPRSMVLHHGLFIPE